MSSIDKLLIRGIRSFSPYNENVIEFYTPLTIIVGHNGAGKTTIIECLKYATTGDLPPNSKGGAFVHDPKVSREAEVKGQIKLKFKNVKGQTMVVTRSMQSTQKRSKLEQKTLESLLVTNDPVTGDQVSISSRCAEMDGEIPLQLGVSRAVLENVIFCHQEESFWPLSEPSVLKKKFDDIFAATRYTKALDALKAVRKDLANELKLEQQKLEYLRIDKDKAARIQLDIEKSERRCEQGQNTMAAIDAQMAEVRQTIDALVQDLRSLKDIQAEWERLERDIDAARCNQGELMRGMQPMGESDQQLQTMLEQLSKRTTRDATTLQAHQEQKHALEQSIADHGRQFGHLSTRVGVLKAELGRISDRRSVLEQMLRDVTTRMELCPSVESSQVLPAARKRIEEHSLALQRLHDETTQRHSTFSQKLQAITVQSSTLSESRRMKRKTIEETQRRLTRVLDQLNGGVSAQDRLNGLQLRLLEEEASFHELGKLFAAANYDARLETLHVQRKQIEGEIQTINNRIASAARHADLRAKLEVKRAELRRKQELLARLYGEVQFDVDMAAGCAVPIGEAEREMDRLWRLKERQVKTHQERLNNATQTSCVALSKYEHARTLLGAKEREVVDKQKRVQKVCGDKDFTLYFEDAESDLARISEDLASSLSSKTTYEAFSKAFGQSRDCPLCTRGFASRAEEEQFGKKLGQFIDSLPIKLAELYTHKQRAEAKVAEIKGLRSMNDDIERLRHVEVPGLEDAIRSLEGEKDRAQAALDDLGSEATTLALEEKRLAGLRRRCEELGKLHRDCEALQGEVERAEKDGEALGADFDIAGAEDQLQRLALQQRETVQNIEKTGDDMKKHQGDLQTREVRYRETKEQLMGMQLKQSEIVVLEQSRQELEAQASSLSREVDQAQVSLDSLAREETMLTEELSRWKRKSDSQVRQQTEQLKTFEGWVRECGAVEADIER